MEQLPERPPTVRGLSYGVLQSLLSRGMSFAEIGQSPSQEHVSFDEDTLTVVDEEVISFSPSPSLFLLSVPQLFSLASPCICPESHPPVHLSFYLLV